MLWRLQRLHILFDSYGLCILCMYVCCVNVVFDYIWMLKRRIPSFIPVWLWVMEPLSGLNCTPCCFNCKQCSSCMLFKWCNLWEKLAGGDDFVIAQAHRKMLDKRSSLRCIMSQYIYIVSVSLTLTITGSQSVHVAWHQDQQIHAEDTLTGLSATLNPPSWLLGKGWLVNGDGSPLLCSAHLINMPV